MTPDASVSRMLVIRPRSDQETMLSATCPRKCNSAMRYSSRRPDNPRGLAVRCPARGLHKAPGADVSFSQLYFFSAQVREDAGIWQAVS